MTRDVLFLEGRPVFGHTTAARGLVCVLDEKDLRAGFRFARLLPSRLASPCFLVTLSCLVAYTDLAACRHVPAFRGALEDRHTWFAWVVWTGALAPLVKGSRRNGLFSSSGVPSWGAEPDPETGNRKPEGRYLGLFCRLSVGQTLLASKEDQPGSSKARGGCAGGVDGA